ncbi:MAG TPA: alpha/beta hydrolase-fold protein [Pyrinomonadaceae bacterium]|nr:alpha/beta hydrolase-fold protein [Pyrinomonadaceae bacterium]
MRSVILSLLVAAIFAMHSPYPEETLWRDAASPRIEAVRQQAQSGEKKAVARFWNEIKVCGTPLIEQIPDDQQHVLVTFLYRAETPVKGVVLMAQLYVHDDRDDSLRVLVHLPDTDIWYKTYWIRSDMRFTYSLVPNPTAQSFAYNSELQLKDSLNPKYVAPGTNVGKSVVELPAAVKQPWILPNPAVPKGKLEEVEIESKVLGSQRRFWIYTPAGYDPKRVASYPMLVCFDGWVYSRPEFVPTPTILDNLIAAERIPPMLAIFIDQAPQPQRNIELTNNRMFLDFVVEDLLRQVRQRWRATSNPAATIVCGSSTGGLASAFFAFSRPDIFGNVLSQSGAFWPGKEHSDPDHEWLTRQFQSSPKLAIRFVLQVGALETGGPTPLNGPSILKTNRHLRDVLRAKGYEVQYEEIAGGHESISWRGGIAEGLIQLLNRRRW